jgi:hypothetical protein
MSCHFPAFKLTVGLVLCLLAGPVVFAAPPVWREGFEGPQPSWRAAGGDAHYRILQQQRVAGQARSGRRCEWLQLVGDNGTAVYIGHDVGRPRVIEELLPSVWIMSDRPGLQFAADIVLPRATDRRTGKPLLARVFGAVYNTPGHWQQLRIDGIPQLLARQLRVMRSQLGTDVDGREAYIHRVLLNVYGGPGVTNVWIDDLEIAGYVSAAAVTPGAPSVRGGPRPPAADAILPASLPTPRHGSLDLPAGPGVRLSESVLLADGEPIFPRVIQYQGEPLLLLKQMGFNAIWSAELPSPQVREELERLGMWLVCPPPGLPDAEPPGAAPAAAGQFGPEFQRVLAWDLGSDLIGPQLAGVQCRAQQVRAADSRQHRPLLCSPRNELRGYSRQVDLLLIDRRPLGSSLELTDYGTWVRRQPLLALPGTPVWTTVQTQPNEGLRRQLAALQPGRPLPNSVTGEQMRLLVYTAISAGSRGLVFLSRSPLSATDPETRQRAMDLELLNLELRVIEPWAAAGNYVTTAETSSRDVTGAVLRMDRARVVLPLWSGSGGQCAAAETTGKDLAMVVPGTPQSIYAYQLTLGRLEPLRTKRATGGIRVNLENFPLNDVVLFAQDPSIVDEMMHRVAACGQRQAELECALAEQRFRAAKELAGQLARHAPPAAFVSQHLEAAGKDLQAARVQLAAGQFPTADSHARQTIRSLRQLERAYWQVAAGKRASPAASPGTASFATLPWHWSLMDRLTAWPPGPNLLAAGDFERLEVMVRAGWRHYQHPVEGVHTAADLVAEAAHRGRLGLRLTARPDNPETPPAILETPPVWITSPAVPVQPGQLVRIHGWVNVPAPIAASVDGLLVVDSLAGNDLAARIDRTAGWQEFTLYRAALQSGAVTVTFALSGLGEARLDDVSIEVR